MWVGQEVGLSGFIKKGVLWRSLQKCTTPDEGFDSIRFRNWEVVYDRKGNTPKSPEKKKPN